MSLPLARRLLIVGSAIVSSAALVLGGAVGTSATASTPSSSTLGPPSGDQPSTATWSGTFAATGRVDGSLPCDALQDVNCDRHALTIDVPSGFWKTNDGSVSVKITWQNSTDDLDLYVKDANGNTVGQSASGGTTSEAVDLGELAPGTYTVEVGSYAAQPGMTYQGTATLDATELSGAMAFPEDKNTIMDKLTARYPLRVAFVGRKPTAQEIADLRANIPTEYKPTVANKSPSPSDPANTGASLLNWNKQYYQPGESPYFLGVKFKYDLQILVATKAYTQALFAVAKKSTAQAQSFNNPQYGANLASYDAQNGKFRVAAKGGDTSYEVSDPTKTDLIDAYAVENWIFKSRTDPKWRCAFKNAETGACVGANVVQDSQGAYRDPYYDRSGLNLDRMPQGLNRGSTYFFFDTFTPSYAAKYFRPNAYHTWGTDKVIDGKIIPKPVAKGGSWRITDPDTGQWDGVDYGRTWGGRYRFHFVDLGAAPNPFESATWVSTKVPMSSDYPYGDPPIWQYDADPRWRQTGPSCTDSPKEYTGGTPCRLMPRIARDVAYGLFFRSTPGYLYRPIPRGDVNWLAVSNWTDFYSRPQWVNGQLTAAPWYGTWWTNTRKLYRIGTAAGGAKQDDTLRWLSSATPYTRWVGRRGETIRLYDPKTNQPTGKTLDTAPKYEDLPAPDYKFQSSAAGAGLVPEPLDTGKDVVTGYGVNLSQVSNAVEKAKAYGVLGLSYDDSVNYEVFRDFVDANRTGIADRVTGVNTIPAINMVFEKAYTWALPAIVGGIAAGTADGEAWGVLNNVNDRFKSCSSNYPVKDSSTQPGQPASLLPCSPTQNSGTGFSYTIEHEAAHNLGLTHPHDGSYGVDKCPAGDPNAGKWQCYWNGLGWMYDISAAPTTYAMSYRPYEVEDQDTLQRGRVAEYLIGAQDVLRERLKVQAEAGRTTPTAAWQADYQAMKRWREQAATLFRRGDYLHAEYAARNASLAAQGVPQTSARTTQPRLVQAGQVFYFRVNPQADRRITY